MDESGCTPYLVSPFKVVSKSLQSSFGSYGALRLLTLMLRPGNDRDNVDSNYLFWRDEVGCVQLEIVVVTVVVALLRQPIGLYSICMPCMQPVSASQAYLNDLLTCHRCGNSLYAQGSPSTTSAHGAASPDHSSNFAGWLSNVLALEYSRRRAVDGTSSALCEMRRALQRSRVSAGAGEAALPSKSHG